MGILAQPTETIDAIAGWIDDAEDVLAFALTSKIISRIVSPRHTQFRHIRCEVTDVFVWNTLAAAPALARNVRSLEVHDRKARRLLRTTVCQGAGSQRSRTSQRDAELALMAALKEMWYLDSFTWNAMPPRVIAEQDIRGEDVWTCLYSCKNLTKLDIQERCRRYALPPFPIWGSTVFTKFGGVTSFTYVTKVIFTQVTSADIEMLGTMLRERCPNLQHLALSFYPFQDDHFFDIGQSVLTGRWPALRSVHLRGVACGPDLVVAFFAAHPGLVDVSLNDIMGPRPEPMDPDEFFPLSLLCPPEILLPNLCRLESSADLALDILSDSAQLPRPVHSWHMHDPYCLLDPDVDSRLFPLLPSLRTVYLEICTMDAVSRIAQYAPWVEELEFGTGVPGHGDLISDRDSEERKEQWQAALAGFHRLRSFTLRPPKHYPWDDQPEDVDLLALIRGPPVTGGEAVSDC